MWVVIGLISAAYRVFARLSQAIPHLHPITGIDYSNSAPIAGES